ncbi:helix-turn-helix transcriptional regulator [Parabacteroides goldsteinii]|uniref:helix-turn-helix domain-containing protein n=1 Tax=Parabacteroides goldsteinii TaxID=328812 RepID=UPI0032BFD18E
MANLQLISELLKKKKMSQKDFCEQVGLTDVSLRRIIERNSTKTETLEKIAEVLNVPIGYFFGEQSGIVISGEHNQVHNGLGNQIMTTPEQREIEHLRAIIDAKDKIIEEKERLIQVLINK